MGPDFIALLVLNVFNATLSRSDIRADLQHRPEVCSRSANAAQGTCCS